LSTDFGGVAHVKKKMKEEINGKKEKRVSVSENEVYGRNECGGIKGVR